MAIRRSPDDCLGSNITCGTGPILDHAWLAKALLQPLSD
jgi:hypothetical protein